MAPTQTLPSLTPEMLGDRAFREAHGVKYAYVAGAMANGIASEELVEAMAKAGFLAYFGAAGLSLERVEAAIDRLQGSLGDLPHGFNFIHSPNEPGLEDAVVDLYLRKGVARIEASAFMDLTPALVRYRVKGLRREGGVVVASNKVMGKVSRVEVATKFFSPAPERILKDLLAAGTITPEEAELAREVPMADDVTAEADSGGHTDNRPAITLIPTLIALRDRLAAQTGFQGLRVGAAGGVSTPSAAAAAFSMGASYLVTGSINQATLEAGTSDAVREMLAQAEQADCVMAPAADMFEMGVKVQVLKRGTMFAMRAAKLYELYRAYPSLEAIPADERARQEKMVFKESFDRVWADTKAFFETRDPREVAKAENDPKHKMALVFRSYLGRASRWANAGEPSRKVDYQVWCGPAMGAFNEWVKGTPLEDWRNRRVAEVAKTLLEATARRIQADVQRYQGMN